MNKYTEKLLRVEFQSKENDTGRGQHDPTRALAARVVLSLSSYELLVGGLRNASV